MTAARLVQLLAMADEAPEVDELEPFLTDPDAEVRRTALSVLSESVDDWGRGSVRIARALLDPDAAVRLAGIDLLAELRELLVPDDEFAAALGQASAHPDPGVRTAAIGALWRHGVLGTADAERFLADPAPVVRGEAVLALASLGALGPLDRAATDPVPEVRVAVARALGGTADPRTTTTLRWLGVDPEPSVVIAALTALGRTGCPPDAATLAVAALRAPGWQVREAAAHALAAAPADLAVEPLLTALTDGNADVRKAAVRALGQLRPDHPELPVALLRAIDDPDADVRAYARLAMRRQKGRP